ncbi:MAG: cyclodeaminase/cyclohydrolase family protein [Planctomycetaceae bacterium]|nr:cyclodeaminase/cyclohydrolase family protein [Planctomycetaceae bacterium]
MTEQGSQQDMLSLPVRDFVAATAAKTPTPGGGSVAGVVGALGAALGEMSLAFTRGKKKFAQHEEYYAQLQRRLELARGMFEDLVADDIAAYTLYQSATKMDDSPEKTEAMALATAAAIDVPREATKVALALLEDLKGLVNRVNSYLITDLLAGAVLAVAAARLSDYNVRVNVPNLADRPAAAELAMTSAADLSRAQRLLDEIEAASKEYLP